MTTPLHAVAEILAVGMSTTRGRRADVMAGTIELSDEPWPWPLSSAAVSRLCRPARDVRPGLAGPDRFAALAQTALQDCLDAAATAPDMPLVLGTCNGAAAGYSPDAWQRAFAPERLLTGTPWAQATVPVVSAGCASGLHALFLAFAMLQRHACVMVLAEDILSPACHANFESLRILAASVQPPWQGSTEGFLMGEAAVAVLLSRGGQGGLSVSRPVLSQDRAGSDGFARVLRGSTRNPTLILGQGTGPVAVDRQELATLARTYHRSIPIATPVVDFGHTLGASSLLSLALSCTGAQLSLIAPATSDGRPIARQIPRGADIAVSCRALGGACGLVEAGATGLSSCDQDLSWQESTSEQPIATRAIRELTALARSHRPEVPPSALLVWLATPLLPSPSASRNGRLLPSAILEMTPGFAAMSIARAWGYTGPTVCLVGGSPPATRQFDLAGPGSEVAFVEVTPHGEPGDERLDIRWSTDAR